MFILYYVIFYYFYYLVQLDIPAGQKYYVSGGGLPGQYVMDQMHFHWSSEHTINSER